MRPGRAADHSPPSSAAVMEEESYTSTHPLGHTVPVTGSLYLIPLPLYSGKDCLTPVNIKRMLYRYCLPCVMVT